MMDFLFSLNGQLFIAAYLVGGIPFGLLLAKFFAGVDIKAAGSGSIGATKCPSCCQRKRSKVSEKTRSCNTCA